ncbi:LPXTG cell wall anchor domain-containing protein [Mediterraneibacter gnavus]|uniref:LPXTG cell wall anchor domain-containing protein n=1 Tax=Mediterraneibacter gnavus TaxID=33038 RepID=UPI000E4AEBB2|nr:LPXTG cell wall anchor domain-containing protein [Mediterraneibacter gnavus]
MKKKFVVALVAAMSLTVAGTGTVFAMDKVSTVASEKEHVHGDNCEWVVDKPAWTETVEHPEEGHWEEVVVQEAWDEEVTRIGTFCHNCGFEIHSIDEWIAHSKASNGQCMSYGDKEVTEIIHHEAVVENQWVVDKEAWTETVEHPEEGHWVCNGEPQEPEQKPEQPEQPENPDQKPEQPEQPENPDQKPEQPEQPENPDQKPEQPENPDVETPETPEAENPETPEQKPEAPTTPEANKENVQTQATETKKEGTSPKTGDTTSALPVAGAGVASLGVALATILKKRK